MVRLQLIRRTDKFLPAMASGMRIRKERWSQHSLLNIERALGGEASTGTAVVDKIELRLWRLERHTIDTTCPFCRQTHDKTKVSEAICPQDGDLTLCFCCGQFSAFDSEAILRKPTQKSCTGFTRLSCARRIDRVEGG